MNVLLLPPTAFDSDKATITNPAQLSHVRTVLKSAVGDTLKIGELGGRLGTGTIDELDDTGITLTNVRLDTAPPPKLPLTVVLALPRPKVLRRLIMDMTAIGVAHIVLMNSYRTDKSYWQSPLMARLDDFILEGLQQGVDTIAPTISFEKRFKPFIEDRLTTLPTPIVLAHPYGGQPITDITKPCTVIIGAEGGFIDYEVALIKAQGVDVVSLGSRILRTEAVVNGLIGYWGFGTDPCQ